MQINIDKFEFLCLLKGCAAGSHLCQGIWHKAIDCFYPKMSGDERLWLYTYAKRDLTEYYIREDAVGRDDFFQFLACFNPTNRYTLTVEGDVDGKHTKQTVEAYHWQGKYYIKSRQYAADEYIKSKEWHCDFDKCNTKCDWHKSCARYREDAPDGFGKHEHCRCDWYVNMDADDGVNFEHYK